MKKSFIIHLDSLVILDKLTKEQAGELLFAMRDYHLGIEKELDVVTDIVFTPFKLQFERDEEKYQNTCNRNKINGLNGGRPKTQRTQQNPVGYSETQQNPTKPKKPDNDNDNDSKNDSKRERKNNIDVNDDANFITASIKHLFKEQYITNTTNKLFDKLLKKYTKEDIILAINWAKNDSFWNTNFLSPAKLESKNSDKVLYIDVFLEKAKHSKYIMPNIPQQMTDEEKEIQRLKDLGYK